MMVMMMKMMMMMMMMMIENDMLRPWDHGGDVGCYVADILRDDEEDHHNDHGPFGGEISS